MAKFDLKWSNILKIVVVILLVVGLYNLVYNSNVFNYSMYEGLDEDKFFNILTKYNDFTKMITEAVYNLGQSGLDTNRNSYIDNKIIDMRDSTISIRNSLYNNDEYKKQTTVLWDNLLKKLDDAIFISRDMTKTAKDGENENYYKAATLKTIMSDTTKQLKDLKTTYLDITRQSNQPL